MSEEPGSVPSAAPMVGTYVVTIEGYFGAVTWIVGQSLWAMLPRNERIQAIEASRNRISDLFERVTDNVLRHGGSSLSARDIATESSLETIEHGCDCIGQLVWQLPQDFVDQLPEDQKEALLHIAREQSSYLFHEEILRAYTRFIAKRSLGL